jgi:polyferredoxin
MQVTWSFLTNGYLAFPWTKSIYQGSLKSFCSPGFNCYSCPAATFACPIGAFQNSMATVRPSLAAGKYHLGLYVIGLLGMIGSVVGRMPCGWVCPFGFLQEMIYKIPFKKLRMPKILTYGKFIALVLFVCLLPLVLVDKFGFGETWFCKYICPAGTLEAGIPVILLQPQLKEQIGLLFYFKLAILGIIMIAMLAFKRPFCRALCPLGAFYSLFNKVSLFRMDINLDTCLECDECQRVCPTDIRMYEDPNDSDCIRCLECARVCKTSSISYGFIGFPSTATFPK